MSGEDAALLRMALYALAGAVFGWFIRKYRELRKLPPLVEPEEKSGAHLVDPELHLFLDRARERNARFEDRKRAHEEEKAAKEERERKLLAKAIVDEMEGRGTAYRGNP